MKIKIEYLKSEQDEANPGIHAVVTRQVAEGLGLSVTHENLPSGEAGPVVVVDVPTNQKMAEFLRALAETYD